MFENQFTKSEARRSFRYLKSGICPPDKIGFFTVGLDTELYRIRTELKSIAIGKTNGASYFLEAPYGYGKSHLLTVIKSIALKQNFGVAQVSLDSYERAFNHPERYIHYLYESLSVPGFSVRGAGEVVPRILRGAHRNDLLRWADTPRVRWGIGYYISRLAASSDASNSSSIKYFINSCDIQYRSGAYYYLLYERLKLLSDLCRAIGLSGLVVLFDEIESVVNLLPNILSRLKSYEILNRLIDSSEFPYCCLYFAASPDFGYKVANLDFRYEYNYYKVHYSEGCKFMEKWANSKVEVIKVPKVSRANNKELLSKLKGLHEYAYSWKSNGVFSPKFIESFIDEAEKNSLLQRDMVRSFVNVMDTGQQHPSCNPAKELSLLVPPNVAELLRGQGLEVIDNRSSGGALWVVGGLELTQLLQQMRNQGILFRFASGGGQATKGRPAWWARSPL